MLKVSHTGFAPWWTVVLLGSLSACSSSSGVRSERSASDQPAAVDQTVLIVDDRGLMARELGSTTSRSITSELKSVVEFWPSPAGGHTAVAGEGVAGTILGLLEPEGSFSELYRISGSGEFSVVWAPSGDSLMFGFKGSEERGIHMLAIGSESTTDVGCSASSIAHSWGMDDWFVVGDGSNLYVVERTGCGTIESVDARKQHELTFSPDGRRAAYVLRELEYDREAREYRPDSSLYIARSSGADPLLVVGDRYKPRRPVWSPDGTSLAFDAELPDAPGRRLISIYDVEQKQSAFLTPKAVKSKVSQWAPRWSPEGSAVAYLESSKGDSPRIAVRRMAESFSSTVGETAEEFAGWLTDRQIILRGPNFTRIVDVDAKTSYRLDGTLWVVPSSERR
jgi:hypothetical protein